MNESQSLPDNDENNTPEEDHKVIKNFDDLIEELSEFKYNDKAIGVLVLKFQADRNPYFHFYAKDNTKYSLTLEEIIGSIELMKSRIMHDNFILSDMMEELDEDGETEE